MSVTFTIAAYRELTSPFTGSNRETVLVMGPDHTHSICPTPDTCEDFGVYNYCDHIAADEAACGCKDLDVNVSNANAMAILERLGYAADPESLYGDATPDDILGRAMVANVGRDDSGIADTVDGNMIDCGVRAGYYDARMSRIIDLATAARARGLMVAWA